MPINVLATYKMMTALSSMREVEIQSIGRLVVGVVEVVEVVVEVVDGADAVRA